MDEKTRKAYELGRDLAEAKVRVLLKHNFTLEEIARVMGTTEAVIQKRYIDKMENSEGS